MTNQAVIDAIFKEIFSHLYTENGKTVVHYNTLIKIKERIKRQVDAVDVVKYSDCCDGVLR